MRRLAQRGDLRLHFGEIGGQRFEFGGAHFLRHEFGAQRGDFAILRVEPCVCFRIFLCEQRIQPLDRRERHAVRIDHVDAFVGFTEMARRIEVLRRRAYVAALRLLRARPERCCWSR